VTARLRQARVVLATTLVPGARCRGSRRNASCRRGRSNSCGRLYRQRQGVFAGDDVRIRGAAVGKILKTEPQPPRS
jgi:phospholipid/cholesterol/gamma-HCH transport system substrate-binding protein